MLTLANVLLEHLGNEVEIAIYGDPDDPADVCLEDMTQNSVILDSELYDLFPVITEERIEAAERVLTDNGIDADEAETVLQAIGYVLLDTELYPERGC